MERASLNFERLQSRELEMLHITFKNPMRRWQRDRIESGNLQFGYESVAVPFYIVGCQTMCTMSPSTVTSKNRNKNSQCVEFPIKGLRSRHFFNSFCFDNLCRPLERDCGQRRSRLQTSPGICFSLRITNIMADVSVSSRLCSLNIFFLWVLP